MHRYSFLHKSIKIQEALSLQMIDVDIQYYSFSIHKALKLQMCDLPLLAGRRKDAQMKI